MKGGSFKVGQAFGIDVKVHWTFLLLLLFFAGYGYAQSGNLFGKPSDEVKIAIAGPLVNVVLAAILNGITYLGFGSAGLRVPDLTVSGVSLGSVVSYLAFISVILAGFNFIPAFPMDEGRVLRGLLAAAHSPGRFNYVRDLMTTTLTTLSPGADLFGEGYRLLQESSLRALPVVEGGKLVGMLTIEDIGHASLLREQPTTRG